VLSIIIVSYNCRDALRQCLASLPAGRVVVVDNGGDADFVRREFPAVNFIANDSNRGFAAACNQGIRATTEPFVLLLNPDTVVTRSALEQLLAVMSDKRIGACGPRIRNADGSPQISVRRFPTLGRLVLAEFGLRGRYYVTRPGTDVDQLMGSCLLLRRAALEEIGLLDERFFVYFEEVDLCLRLKQAGWRVVFAPDAEITHIGGQSSQTDRTASLRYRYRSLFEFYRKHYPHWQLPVLKLAIQIAALLRVLTGQRDYRAIAKEVWSL
jgi:N-acetylglucosaminyl-diphospho-decaprenol L-rhamnosyltransferase